MLDDKKVAWVGLNTALARVENAIGSLGGVPDLGDGDGINPDSLDSFIGLIELDLVRVREALNVRLRQLEGEIRGELQVL